MDQMQAMQTYGATEEEAQASFQQLKIAAENTAKAATLPIWAKMAIKAVWPLLVTFVTRIPGIDDEARTILLTSLDYIYKKLITPNLEPIPLHSGEAVDVDALVKQLKEKDQRIMELAASVKAERKAEVGTEITKTIPARKAK